jgi:hypothetical protein
MRLRFIIENERHRGPIIRSIQWSPAALTVQFPSGEIWEYVIYENRWLQDLLRSHRRNVGRLVAAVKRIPNIEAQRVDDMGWPLENPQK